MANTAAWLVVLAGVQAVCLLGAVAAAVWSVCALGRQTKAAIIDRAVHMLSASGFHNSLSKLNACCAPAPNDLRECYQALNFVALLFDTGCLDAITCRRLLAQKTACIVLHAHDRACSQPANYDRRNIETLKRLFCAEEGRPTSVAECRSAVAQYRSSVVEALKKLGRTLGQLPRDC